MGTDTQAIIPHRLPLRKILSFVPTLNSLSSLTWFLSYQEGDFSNRDPKCEGGFVSYESSNALSLEVYSRFMVLTTVVRWNFFKTQALKDKTDHIETGQFKSMAHALARSCKSSSVAYVPDTLLPVSTINQNLISQAKLPAFLLSQNKDYIIFEHVGDD